MKNSVVFIVPTGIGAEIGGHAGDANPVAKLVASTCENFITHPNVVNASDINEMSHNTLYVEGSMLDRFLENKIGLEKVCGNKILFVVNAPIHKETINAISAARVTVGADIMVVTLKTPLKMTGRIENGIATGDVSGWQELVKQVKMYDFDALGIASEIKVGRDISLRYYREGGVNPWGGVEAIASKLIADALDKPVAHAPVEFSMVENDNELFMLPLNEIVDPRIAPEAISTCYLHCIIKGLHKAPQIGNDVTVDNVLCMVTPYNCMGRPHKACLQNKIPVIAVRENKTVLNDLMPDEFLIAENYLEATGMIMALKKGISFESVRRPIPDTIVMEG